MPTDRLRFRGDNSLGCDKPLFKIDTLFEHIFIKNNYKSYQLNAVRSTPRTILSSEIDNVYEECRYDGWTNDTKEKSKGIIYSSYINIKEFIYYLENFNLAPMVVPYKNGCLGLEWNKEDKTITMMFMGNNKYIYSIITNSLNEYGENDQTEENQISIINRISGLLKNA